MDDRTAGAGLRAEGRLALDFVDTRIEGPHGLVELLDSPTAAAGWIRDRMPGMTFRADERSWRSLIGVRTDARELLLAVASGEALPERARTAINRSAAHPGFPVLEADRSLGWKDAAAPSATAALARSVIALLTSDQAAAIRQCAADDCDRLFIRDHGRRVWCSSACGNRMRVRRHAAAQRSGRAPARRGA